MADLSLLFEDIKKNKKNYTSSKTGEDFEDRIIAQLKKIGFSSIIKADVDNEGDTPGWFQSIKKQVLKEDSDKLISNPLANFRKDFMHQPFGKQSYPDFLIFNDNKVVSIEAKFSKNSQKKPIWNSGLPRPNGIYVFGANLLDDVTFFLGRDLLNIKEVRQLHKFFQKLKIQEKDFNKKYMSKQKYGFAAYSRKAYEQKKYYNEQAIVDYFANKNREQLEDSVIKYLK